MKQDTEKIRKETDEMFEGIKNGIKHLTNIIDENYIERADIKYSFLSKGYWLINDIEDYYLGETLGQATTNLIRHLKIVQ